MEKNSFITNFISKKFLLNNIFSLDSKQLLFELSPKFDLKNSRTRKKGDLGVTGVIGGSIEYTGAPYYSAVSSLKSGADLAHIFCHKDASIPIKSYSPELIVHPAFDDNMNQDLINKTIRWFKAMDVLVYGCGLGREYPTEEIFNVFISESSKIKSKKLILL